MIIQKVTMTILIFLGLNFCLFNLPGKCEKEKKKKQSCILNNLLACKLTPYHEKYQEIGVDICLNPDGFLFALVGSCDRYVSYECGGPSSSSSSSSSSKK